MIKHKENIWKLIEALGGPYNIESVDSCMTKLRVIIKDEKIIAPNSLFETELGAKGVIRANSGLQLIYGKYSTPIKEEMQGILEVIHSTKIFDKLVEALGGASNIESVDYCMTKLRIIVKDETKLANNSVFENELEAKGVVRANSGIQLVYGRYSKIYKEKLEKLIK